MKSPSTGQVCIQVHADATSSYDLASLKTACESLAATLASALGVQFEEGDDGGRYLNIVFGSHAPEDLWPSINATLYQSAVHGPVLRSRSMALRTGSDGWNDYVLLYHFDPTVPVERTQ
ncbi:hypothetical protein [uncultured Methylibium sp.]|uniref:hypothetical protein n=1 Tax=uncultured Methylibium sp. TaxID=381093 RepID=UPI0025D72D34|nr:hypothetical protein [uncultured Methylibium sp.]